jgi:hypothetical protein
MTERTYCPPPTEGFQPDKTITETIVHRSFSVSTDSSKYCTFGEAVPTERILERIDSQEVAVVTTPTAYSTDPVPKREERETISKDGMKVPPTAVASPSPTASTPTETPKTAETPTPTPAETLKTPEQPPPTKTTDNPPDIPTTTETPRVTIFIKASEAVLESGQSGEPIQGQIVKLVIKEKPALPTAPESRTAMDKGFDKPAPQCTTGTDGQCKVEVPQEDRALYALNEAPRGGKPANNYRLAINVMNHTGGVAETTGKQTLAVGEPTS